MDVQNLSNSFIRLYNFELDKVLTCVWGTIIFMEEIKDKEFKDGKSCLIWDKVLKGKTKESIIDQ